MYFTYCIQTQRYVKKEKMFFVIIIIKSQWV